MEIIHTGPPRFIDALRRPSSAFATPFDVLEVASWNASKKRAVLEVWRLDEELLEKADDDGLQGRSDAALFEVVEAQKTLASEVGRGDGLTSISPEPTGPSAGTHKVAGVFLTRAEAAATVSRLRAAGFADDAVHLIGPDEAAALDAPQAAGSSETARTILAGAAVGATGAVTVAALLAAPILSGLVAAGIGAALGSGLGATAKFALSEQDFRDLAEEALDDGAWLVIIEVDSETRALTAQDIFARSAATRSIDQSGAVREHESDLA